MDTRPHPMTPEDVKRLEQLLAQRGASVAFQDARVTRATNVILGLVGTGLLGFLLSINSQLGALREQNASLIAELKYQEQINQAQDSRLSIYDDRLRSVERQVK
jgi:hypothetical protein